MLVVSLRNRIAGKHVNFNQKGGSNNKKNQKRVRFSPSTPNISSVIDCDPIIEDTKKVKKRVVLGELSSNDIFLKQNMRAANTDSSQITQTTPEIHHKQNGDTNRVKKRVVLGDLSSNDSFLKRKVRGGNSASSQIPCSPTTPDIHHKENGFVRFTPLTSESTVRTQSRDKGKKPMYNSEEDVPITPKNLNFSTEQVEDSDTEENDNYFRYQEDGTYLFSSDGMYKSPTLYFLHGIFSYYKHIL